MLVQRNDHLLHLAQNEMQLWIYVESFCKIILLHVTPRMYLVEFKLNIAKWIKVLIEIRESVFRILYRTAIWAMLSLEN